MKNKEKLNCDNKLLNEIVYRISEEDQEELIEIRCEHEEDGLWLVETDKHIYYFENLVTIKTKNGL